MGRQYQSIPENLISFIKQQQMFFVATATEDSRINLSPKGMDTLRVLNGNRVIWLNMTGSGNETAAHVQQTPRMTIMFCAFDGAPMILRLYGNAKVIHHNDSEWDTLYGQFNPLPGARQIFDLDIDLVQSSCGMSVPILNYAEQREQLTHWAEKKGDSGIKAYWLEKNQTSLDGIPSHIVEKNTVK